MVSPKLYTVVSLPLNFVLANNYHIYLDRSDQKQFEIKQQDNMLFRQIRLITGYNSRYNKSVVFIDCGKSSNSEEAIKHLLYEGLLFNGRKFVFSERSASMVRTGIISMIDTSIADELNKRITMDIRFEQTQLAKYYAYRGLMFSSCHCLEDWRPKIIIVPDFERAVSKQRVKYIYDREVLLPDGKPFKQKDVTEGVRDITINAFDGCGICHPSLMNEITEMLGSDYPVTSAIIRAPYIKGMVHSVDYEKFADEHGVEYIQDIWGKWHSVHDAMMILPESMYKGIKYFKVYGDARDWDLYWDRFEKYEHCIGIARWNFSFSSEPVYTRGNYQILQDLKLDYRDFAKLFDYSAEWVEKLLDDDRAFTDCFLGLFADRANPINDYTAAILKNHEMRHEYSVRQHLISSVKKYIDDFKCGRLWLRGSFKFIMPDMILFMEHILRLPLKGSLRAGEIWSQDKDGVIVGERLLERNPHICHSEHAVVSCVRNEEIERYCGHLANVAMLNSESIICQRLNGADFDGDIAFLIDNKTMIDGVDRDIPVTIDVEDKVTAIAQPDTIDNKFACILRTTKSFIGEYSNYATAYHNKQPKTSEQKKKYEHFIDITSVIVGKSIDYAKTGVMYLIPRHIAKYGRPLPYFMKYASDYYAKQDLSKAYSNMNRLCMDIEKWEKKIKWKRSYKDFDWHIMIDNSIPPDKSKYDDIEKIFHDFCEELRELSKEQMRIRSYFDDDIRDNLSRFDAVNFSFNWDEVYEKYRQRCYVVCPNVKELANICVQLCYEGHPTWNRRFLWAMAGSGIVSNIPHGDGVLPIRDDNGSITYLGNRYRLAEANGYA